MAKPKRKPTVINIEPGFNVEFGLFQTVLKTTTSAIALSLKGELKLNNALSNHLAKCGLGLGQTLMTFEDKDER